MTPITPQRAISGKGALLHTPPFLIQRSEFEVYPNYIGTKD